jgi:hypothetical protein
MKSNAAASSADRSNGNKELGKDDGVCGNGDCCRTSVSGVGAATALLLTSAPE